MAASAFGRAYDQAIAALVNSGERGVLVGGRKGVEKESLGSSSRRRASSWRVGREREKKEREAEEWRKKALFSQSCGERRGRK